ncbi:hypothetical protein KKG46_06170 [Patescibacteria group bacterium]|nr:hypothetical protein [Patescibacteria group bacterium]
MASSFYTGLQDTADKLIRGKGQAVTLTSGTTVYSGFAVEGAVKFGKAGLGADSFKDASMVQSKTRQLTLSAKGFGVIPKPGNTVKIGSSTVSWQVVGVVPISPGGTVVVYYLLVEK